MLALTPMGQAYSLGGGVISGSGNDDCVLAWAQAVKNCLAPHRRPGGEDRAVQMLQSHSCKTTKGCPALVTNSHDQPGHGSLSACGLCLCSNPLGRFGSLGGKQQRQNEERAERHLNAPESGHKFGHLRAGPFSTV